MNHSLPNKKWEQLIANISEKVDGSSNPQFSNRTRNSLYTLKKNPAERQKISNYDFNDCALTEFESWVRHCVREF